ncbi:MAG: hypothetical protein KAT66_00395 [Candidatus Lokiarchaeota archaeon]|nr:hypothetical protein [Candidatus Lokiarchaeota archaeon]
MEEQKEFFETSEFFLSCFLKAKGLKFIKLKKIQGSKYNFVFEKTDNLKEILNYWYKANDERILLQACTDLKYEIRLKKNGGNR